MDGSLAGWNDGWRNELPIQNRMQHIFHVNSNRCFCWPTHLWSKATSWNKNTVKITSYRALTLLLTSFLRHRTEQKRQYRTNTSVSRPRDHLYNVIKAIRWVQSRFPLQMLFFLSNSTWNSNVAPSVSGTTAKCRIKSLNVNSKLWCGQRIALWHNKITHTHAHTPIC